MYCLIFFDNPSPEMIDLVGQRMEPRHSGARWFESICETAWRVYVPLDRATIRDGAE